MDRLEAMAMLLATIETGSFSAAGRMMNVPVATLTRKVTDLEEQLGTRLLMRTTRKLSLTDAGLAYAVTARQILDLVSEQEREATGEFTAPRGELAITTPVRLGRLYVLPEIMNFLALFPEIDVKLTQSDRNVDLVDTYVDVAVRIGRLPDSNMIATRIGAFRTVVCASPALLRERGVPRTPAELARLPCVMYNGPMLSPDWTFRYPDTGLLVTVPISPRLQVSSADSAVDAAVRGFGFTQLLHYHVAEAIDAGELEIILDAFEVDPVPIQLVHVFRSVMPLKLRRFLDFVTPRLRESFSRFTKSA
ncbi:LysR family transcriptional regulator [Burkholderia gladioli]|uniref:LysR family transcriptional regulator n=1 Tax=Burkholderia gladioli TaxID=28095 RepID=UPI00163E380A|nr:LysR family transcriptional regulator [Burkholderia gladioli]